MLDIDSEMVALSEKRPVFHSEADFQFALAWQIQEAFPWWNIRLEFNPVPEDERRMALDIWIPTESTAIELKYTTRRLETTVGTERFVLRDHSAYDFIRYDFLKDIQRLEREMSTGRAKRGIAVLLTNDHLYWNPPQSGRRRRIDEAFRIHEGREITGQLKWSTSASPGSTQGRETPITLGGSYRMCYRDYAKLSAEKHGLFRYLTVSVD